MYSLSDSDLERGGESYDWLVEEGQAEEDQSLGLETGLGLVGDGQLLLLVLDDVDVDAGGRDVVRHAVVLPRRAGADPLYGEDRPGDQAQAGAVGGGGDAGGDGVLVLPHHELGRSEDVTGDALQLEGGPGVDQEAGAAQDVHLQGGGDLNV